MENKILCKNCNRENIVIENKLFFSEEPKPKNIICPVCNNNMQTMYTDGWFFVQTIEDYFFEKEIEEQKKEIIYLEELA